MCEMLDESWPKPPQKMKSQFSSTWSLLLLISFRLSPKMLEMKSEQEKLEKYIIFKFFPSDITQQWYVYLTCISNCPILEEASEHATQYNIIAD